MFPVITSIYSNVKKKDNEETVVDNSSQAITLGRVSSFTSTP